MEFRFWGSNDSQVGDNLAKSFPLEDRRRGPVDETHSANKWGSRGNKEFQHAAAPATIIIAVRSRTHLR